MSRWETQLPAVLWIISVMLFLCVTVYIHLLFCEKFVKPLHRDLSCQPVVKEIICITMGPRGIPDCCLPTFFNASGIVCSLLHAFLKKVDFSFGVFKNY